MKKSNAQLATEMLAAYQRGEQDTIARFVDPEVEVHGAGGIVNGGTFSGLEGFVQWASAWEDAWEDSQYEIVQLSEVTDELVVAAVRVTATGRGSGVPTKDVYGYLWESRDSRVTRFHVYASHDEALSRGGGMAG